MFCIPYREDNINNVLLAHNTGIHVENSYNSHVFPIYISVSWTMMMIMMILMKMVIIMDYKFDFPLCYYFENNKVKLSLSKS
jgi:hypothetical protein